MQQPGSLSVLVGGDTGFVFDFNCRNTPPDFLPYTAGTRRIKYQVLDTSQQAITAPGMIAIERFTPQSNSCVNTASTPTPSSGSTSSDGIFGPDSLGHLCTISCLPADSSDHPIGSCSLAFQQTWNVNGYDVQIKTLTYSCRSVTLQ